MKKELIEILYNKSQDDSECLRIKFEDIDKVVDLQEKIIEDFSIKFVKWNSYGYKYLKNRGWFATSYQLEMGIFLSSKELLEMFKKEYESNR